MERTALTCNSHSRQSRPPTEKGTRKEPRADNSPDLATRATNLLDRGGEYQPRDSASDEAGWRGDGADPRWNEYRQGRRDDVRGLRDQPLLPISKFTLADGCVTGTNSANNTNSARKLDRRSPVSRWESSPTRKSWMPSWRDWNRRLWTSACSTPVLYRSTRSWTGYQRQESQSVG